MPKMAVLAPIPSASVSSATSVKPRLFGQTAKREAQILDGMWTRGPRWWLDGSRNRGVVGLPQSSEKGGYSSTSRRRNASTRIDHRSAPTPKSYRPAGYAPVTRIANHATTVVTTTPAARSNNTMMCGMSDQDPEKDGEAAARPDRVHDSGRAG